MVENVGSQALTSSKRVILHFDLDCFYAQVEQIRSPLLLKDRPLGVTQKFLVVTTNYAARRAGVPKMASITQAKQICPEIILVNGEDLTPYREASKKIMDIIKRYGIFEKRGLDEAVVDISLEVDQRMKFTNDIPTEFSGIVLLPDKTPEELSLLGDCSFAGNNSDFSPLSDLGDLNVRLKIGSHVASEIRSHIELDTGYTCSCGISFSKMFAKLASGLHKPNGQTILLPRNGYEYISHLSVQKLPGVGEKISRTLKDMNVEFVHQLRLVPAAQLNEAFGARIGQQLFENCRGIDRSPVQDKEPPKSVSVENSFRNCTDVKQAGDILSALAPDFICRLDEEFTETGRIPATLVLKWRAKSSGWKFLSTSAKMPVEVISRELDTSVRVDAVVGASVWLLNKHFVNCVMDIVVLNLGAVHFERGASKHSSITSFLMQKRSKSISANQITGKRKARMIRESTLATLQKKQTDHVREEVNLKNVGLITEYDRESSDEEADSESSCDLQTTRCKLCNVIVGPLASDLQEHKDFHFAEKLQKSMEVDTCTSSNHRVVAASNVKQSKKKEKIIIKVNKIDDFFKKIQ